MTVLSTHPPGAMSKDLTISIIIPVLGEEAIIAKLLSHLRALPADGVAQEIIVVDGDPSGSTIRTIREVGVTTAISSPGRSNQMNRGASLATGSALLFLHADTFLPRNALVRISACLEDQRCVGGAFGLGIATDRKIFRITEKYAALRTRVTRVPFGDQAIFFRRAYFERIGGYKSIPLMEDVELMTRVRKRGDRICILPEKVMTSPRRWQKEGIVRGTLRNWILQALYLFGFPPERLATYYRSRTRVKGQTGS